MKKIILALTFLSAISSVGSAQFTATKENLRGLPGVRLIVMFAGATRAEAFDEVKRPGVLKMLEDDTKAKLQEAGIPFSWGSSVDVDDTSKAISKAGARLIVLVRFNVPNGFVHPLEPEVRLLQRVRLARDPSIEFEAESWNLGGVGNKDDIPMMRSLIADLVDSFIRDYLSVNPKQSASSGTDKSQLPNAKLLPQPQ